MTPIEQLHACYQQVTGLEVRLMVWDRAFVDFLATGYTVEDLKLVLEHLMRENKRMNGARFSLRLNSLLDFEYMRFDSLLSEARAVQRNRVVRTPQEKALQAWRGLPTQTGTSDSAQAAGKVAFEALTKLKASL